MLSFLYSLPYVYSPPGGSTSNARRDVQSLFRGSSRGTHMGPWLFLRTCPKCCHCCCLLFVAAEIGNQLVGFDQNSNTHTHTNSNTHTPGKESGEHSSYCTKTTTWRTCNNRSHHYYSLSLSLSQLNVHGTYYSRIVCRVHACTCTLQAHGGSVSQHCSVLQATYCSLCTIRRWERLFHQTEIRRSVWAEGVSLLFPFRVFDVHQ